MSWKHGGVVFRFLVAVLALQASSSHAADLASVTTAAGAVRGVEAQGVISFKGIPYAAPPVGNLRWRVPQPVKPWDGVLDAKSFGPSCMQADDIAKSEDCLTLNVWRPSAAASSPLPVMVWIYGGALVHGNTPQYPADALAAQGVIVVSMNYRMGRLGFFAFPALAKEAPGDPVGNYGYMDQLAALKWVRNNIPAFGGDADKITLFGESAGGGSILAHMVSPLSQGLFARVILQSPGLPTGRRQSLPTASLDAGERVAIHYARSLGIKGRDAKALAAPRALPAAKLVEGTSAPAVLAGMSRGKPVAGVVGAILDGTFLTETPDAAFAAGHQVKVPMIVGANSRELGIGAAKTKTELFALFGTHSAAARELYDPAGKETLEELTQQVLADKTLVEPTRHLADEAVASGQPVWLYRFSYVAESQRAKLPGTLHGFEIPYTMGIPSAIVRDRVTEADKQMGILASGYWVAFASNGDPNGGDRPEWPRYAPSMDRLMNFTNSGLTAGPDPIKARLDLWKTVLDTAP